MGHLGVLGFVPRGDIAMTVTSEHPCFGEVVADIERDRELTRLGVGNSGEPGTYQRGRKRFVHRPLERHRAKAEWIYPPHRLVDIARRLGGPTRQRIRVYADARTPDQIRERKAQGFTAFKTAPALLNGRYARAVENKAWIENAVAQFAALREIVGKDGDIGIDFHGAVPPATAKILMKELEQFQPFFYEEIINCQNVDLMAELAKTTHIPIATGERDFTKWGFRQILEKANFLCQEQVSLGDGYIKNPFKVRDGYVDLPTAPGLGIELDDNAMADKIGHDWRNAETYDPDDGSVTDW